MSLCSRHWTDSRKLTLFDSQTSSMTALPSWKNNGVMTSPRAGIIRDGVTGFDSASASGVYIYIFLIPKGSPFLQHFNENLACLSTVIAPQCFSSAALPSSPIESGFHGSSNASK